MLLMAIVNIGCVNDTVATAITAGRRAICQRRLRMHVSYIDELDTIIARRSARSAVIGL